MKPALLAALVAVPLTTAAVFAGGGSEARKDPLVVHEWGTFTSMQGSDGVGLEGLQREEERLPSFVYSRTKVRDCPLRTYGYKGLEVPVEHVTKKMETPVLYFHSATPRRVRVRVDFVKGLISQWYPVSDLLGPPEADPAAGPLDLAKVDRSFLEWDVDLLPKSGEAPAGIPSVADDDPWAYARQVDAAYLRTVPRQGPERMGPTEAEHYLFYRGLGTFSLPLGVKAVDDLLVFANEGAFPVPFSFALEMGPKGGRYLRLGPVGANAWVRDTFANVPLRPAADVVRDLSSDVSDVLRKQGLFEDEARAMVRTWARSWFAAEGTRVLYLVPRPTTDAILPLSITPAPDELTRVLVGRIEVLTPAVEHEVEDALRARASGDAGKKSAADARLARFDRFLEPVLRRAKARTEDAAVRDAASALLTELAGK
jgi:hypothetical protein